MRRKIIAFITVFVLLSGISAFGWKSLLVGKVYLGLLSDADDYFFPDHWSAAKNNYVLVEKIDPDAVGPYYPFQLKAGWSYSGLLTIWVISILASVFAAIYASWRY